MIRLFSIFCILVFTLAGCGDGDESIANKAGDSVGQALTDFAGGMGKGIDKQMIIKVELSSKLQEKGLSVSVSKQDSLIEKTIVLYFIAARDFEGILLAKGLNKGGQEIGRATTEVNLKQDEAEYTYFKFHKEMDSQLVDHYVVDIK
jgi:hypothetical protein